jgi:hypothetical protein
VGFLSGAPRAKAVVLARKTASATASLTARAA